MAVMCLAFLVAGLSFAVFYHYKRAELLSLETQTKSQIFEQTGQQVRFPLGENYVEATLRSFSVNAFYLSMMVAVFAAIGIGFINHLFIGRKLKQFLDFNLLNTTDHPVVFPAEKIPTNEIGALIQAQNKIVEKLKEKARAFVAMSSFSQLNPYPVIRVDRSGKIVVANLAAEKQFSLEKGILGKNFLDLDLPGEAVDVRKMIDHEIQAQREIKMGDRYFLVELIGIDYLDSLNIYFTDVTERKELESKVLQNSKLASIGELAAGVGHEINNPLAVILGYLELLKSKAMSPEELAGIYEVMEKSVRRAAGIVKSLRSYSQNRNDDSSTFDAHAEIEDSIRLVEKIFSNQSIKIDRQLDAQNFFVTGVPGRFQQVIVNLLNNARDAVMNVENPRISVSTYCEDGNLIVRVKDNGCGISEQNRSKIFDAFFSTKEVGSGTGLGLGISLNIIKSMGGDISVSSDQGRGAEFVISTPYLKADSPDASNVIEPENNNSVKKYSWSALIVDDEKEIQDILSMHLSVLGLSVHSVDNVEKARQAVALQSFDLVFCDLQMPGESGLALLEHIRDFQKNDLFFILITGGDSKNLVEKYRHKKIYPDLVLHKPFSRQQLVDALDKAEFQLKQKKNVA